MEMDDDTRTLIEAIKAARPGSVAQREAIGRGVARFKTMADELMELVCAHNADPAIIESWNDLIDVCVAVVSDDQMPMYLLTLTSGLQTMSEALNHLQGSLKAQAS